jgi:hypothetical protein
MDGHRVHAFWPLARMVVGWHMLTTKELLGKFKEIAAQLELFEETEGKEGGYPLEMDEPELCKAVDTILPEALRGGLRSRAYKQIFMDAFRICLVEIFHPAETSMSGEAKSSAE